MTKYYVIGDIHGRLHKLQDILKQIDYGKDGKIVFLGDYVDRGKDSRKVLTIVKELVEADKAIAIKGNHDDMMSRVHHDPKSINSLWWKQNYLKPTRNSYYTSNGWDRKLYEEHIQFIDSMPLSYKTDTFFFSHSGDFYDPLWGRPGEKDYDIDGKYNVHGHTPIKEPFFGKNRCNLDTGAAWKGGKLTCALFQEGDRIPLKVYRYEGK